MRKNLKSFPFKVVLVLLRYKYENCFAYDGKRVRWTDSFEMLKIFTKYAIEQLGNWLSPGGKYKKFISSNSDLIFTWNYELGTLSFKGEMGDRLKELFITVCSTGKSLPAERSGFEPVALNNDEPLSVSRTKTKAARVSTDNDSATSSNHVSSVQKSKCDCQCGLLAAELEGVKLDLVILQRNVDTRITSAQKTHDDEVTQLRHIYAKERERCELLESDISILVRGRDREINELNNIIVLLENKVESIEALNASLRKSISEQSTKYIQNNYDMNKTSDHVNNYANSKPFSTSDDIYIKSSNNIEHSPLRLPNYFVKKETTNDHARTETICQSREVPAEHLRHNNNQSDQNRQNCLSQKVLPNSKDKPSLISVHEQNEINYQGNQHSMPSPTLTIYDNESPKRNNIVGSTMKINQPRRQCIVLETKAPFIETPNSAIIIKDQQQSKVQVALSSKKTKKKANLDTPFPTTRSSPQVPEWLARLPLIDNDNSTKSLAFINDTTDKNKSDMCKMTSTKQRSLDTSPPTRPSPQVSEWLARLPLIDDDNSTKSRAFKNKTTDKIQGFRPSYARRRTDWIQHLDLVHRVLNPLMQ